MRHTSKPRCVPVGGLGLRRAADVAVPAFLASRVMARPFVESPVSQLGTCGLVGADVLDVFDDGAGRAAAAFSAQLTPARTSRLAELLDDASET
jgi:hypothetical protein